MDECYRKNSGDSGYSSGPGNESEPPTETTSEALIQGESRGIVTHSALQENYDLSYDIYYPLFDCFFDTPQARRWIEEKVPWQLRCNGGPGSGKTTLTSLMARRIRDLNLNRSSGSVYVASVYFLDDVHNDERVFLADFLATIYRQLAPIGECKSTLASTIEGSSTIAEALQIRLAGMKEDDRCFVLIDGMDQCVPSLRDLLEREILALQKRGMNVMITSRLPIFEFQKLKFCDCHKWNEYDESMTFYYRCMSCTEHICCLPCKEEEKSCPKCAINTDWEEPKYINLSVDRITPSSLYKFVAWDLERVHGDIGLASQNPWKPPLSSLGLSFHKAESSTAARECASRIANEAHGSILLAKLGLDVVYSSTTVDAIELARDRLPRNVQAVFNEGIQAMGNQSVGKRDLALEAIAVVAAHKYPVGAPLSRLEIALRKRSRTLVEDLVSPDPKDVLEVTKGYLCLVPPWHEGIEHGISGYNVLFHFFAAQEYNDDIVWARAQLKPSISRSFTHDLTRDELSITEEDRSGRNTEGRVILGDLRRFQVDSPPSMYSPSPPVGRGSPLRRNSTDYFGIKERKPVGLGLRLL